MLLLPPLDIPTDVNMKLLGAAGVWLGIRDVLILRLSASQD